MLPEREDKLKITVTKPQVSIISISFLVNTFNKTIQLKFGFNFSFSGNHNLQKRRWGNPLVACIKHKCGDLIDRGQLACALQLCHNAD